MPEHVHVHAPHELTESEHHPVSGRERLFELLAVLLLSVATVCIAWSRYQAAKWSGLQDLTNFNQWLELTPEPTPVTLGLADLYNGRFRPEFRPEVRPAFRPAFTAWIAQDPLHALKATELAPHAAISTR
jgi:hypothetical protein